MNSYIIRELQNAQSKRAGETIQAKDLAAAKRAASRAQMFQGTVMVVESDAGHRLAVKSGGKWETL